jgi:phospholipid transport system substrate-binding protein
MKQIVVALVLTLVALPGSSFGDEPVDALRTSIDQGIRILNDPRYSAPGQKEAQLDELVVLLQQSVDFAEFSKMVVAVHWKRFSREKRAEFTAVLSEFLSRFYMTKLQEQYRGEKVQFKAQRFIFEKKAEVNLVVTWRDLDVPVLVRMTKRKDAWRAYDAIALGISFMRNYRAQFDGVLRTKSPEQVIDMLKDKIKRSEQKG